MTVVEITGVTRRARNSAMANRWEPGNTPMAIAIVRSAACQTGHRWATRDEIGALGATLSLARELAGNRPPGDGKFRQIRKSTVAVRPQQRANVARAFVRPKT